MWCLCGWGASDGRTLLEVADLLETCFAKNALHRHRLLGGVGRVAGLGFVHSVERGRGGVLVGAGVVLVHGQVVLDSLHGHPKARVDHRAEHVDERSLFGRRREEVRGGGWVDKSGEGVVRLVVKV